MNNKGRLLFISLDNVATKDVEYLKTLPNFSKLCQRGTLVTQVDSVFISNTYPAHTSMITGCLPKDHGIPDNKVFTRKKTNQPWRFDARKIKVPTLYGQAKKEGKTITSILYPVTGKAKIDYNMPEIAQEMNLIKRVATMFRFGSPKFLLSIILRHGRYFKGVGQPSLDNFTTQIALDNLQRKQPDLLLLHLIDTDEKKHIYGPDSVEVQESLERHDKRLGMLLDALHKNGQSEQTRILICSDHGCLPTEHDFDADEFLKEQGLLKDHTYRVYSHMAGGSVFFRALDDSYQKQLAKAMLELERHPAIERALTPEEMAQSGMNMHFTKGFELAEGYSAGGTVKGQHGYGLHHEGYQPFYLALGPDIPGGNTQTGGSILDICPLAADLLGLAPWKMDGKRRI